MSGTGPLAAPAPIIVTALLGERDFAWADGLRRAHFPPERNHLRAHLTLFHHLPPSAGRTLADSLRAETCAPAPRAQLASVIALGQGVAFAIDSPALGDIRACLADHFAGQLIPQDQAGWRPHITIQNKVAPGVARALRDELARDFRRRPIEIAGLAAWYYRGGPWEPIGAWRFGSGHSMRAPC